MTQCFELLVCEFVQAEMSRLTRELLAVVPQAHADLAVIFARTVITFRAPCLYNLQCICVRTLNQNT